VPFELGRPFGPPGDAAFQLDVLRTALNLFNAESGPVLEDFRQDSPDAGAEGTAWTCLLPQQPRAATDDPALALRDRLREEIRLLLPWYAEALRRSGRTSIGASGLGVDAMETIGDVFAALASGGEAPAPPGSAMPMPTVLRYLADDLKAYYFEAAAAQPGARTPNPDELNSWLFRETTFGSVLINARDAVLARPEAADQLPGRFFVPAAFSRRA
jgi:hypothetical protein